MDRLGRIRSALSELVAEDREAFKRLDASSALADDGRWLRPEPPTRS
jgi:hypothetical protein